MTNCAVAAFCAVVGAASQAQVIPASTSGVVYLRSDTIAYPANYVPASGLPNARIALSGKSVVTDAKGAFAIPSSTTPTTNYLPLAASLAGYDA
jgi:hypothetical protein